ncbi:MAG: flagellar hook-length control protein FliK [Pseudomonadales bacterium]
MNSISELFFGPLLQSPVPAALGAATSAGPDASPFAVSLGDARAAQPSPATPAAPGAPGTTPTRTGTADREDPDPGDDPGQDPMRLGASATIPPEGPPVAGVPALPAWLAVPAPQPGDVETALTPQQTGSRLPQAAAEGGKLLPLSASGGVAVAPGGLASAAAVVPAAPGATTGADAAAASAAGAARGEVSAPGQPATAHALPVEALRGPGHPIVGDRVVAGADTPLPASSGQAPGAPQRHERRAVPAQTRTAPAAGAVSAAALGAGADAPESVSMLAAAPKVAPGTSVHPGAAAGSSAADGPVAPRAPGVVETLPPAPAGAAAAAASAAALLERIGQGLADAPAGLPRAAAPGGIALQPLPVPAVGDARPDAVPVGDAAAVAATLDRRALLEAAGRQRGSREANGSATETADRSAGVAVESSEQRNNTLTQRPVLPVLAPRDLSALAERIEMLAHRRLSSASVNLKLGDLGDVGISVRMESRQAHVQFVVQDPAVREALESQLPRLRALLAEGGLDLGDVAANLQGRGEGSGQRESAPAAARGSRLSASATGPDQVTDFRRRPDGDRLLDAFV